MIALTRLKKEKKGVQKKITSRGLYPKKQKRMSTQQKP